MHHTSTVSREIVRTMGDRAYYIGNDVGTQRIDSNFSSEFHHVHSLFVGKFVHIHRKYICTLSKGVEVLTEN